MNLLILHLSDIHLRTEKNSVVAKLDGLRGVIEAHAANVDACVIAVSGDVAYSGKQGEYVIATQLFEGVHSACSKCELPSYFCSVPGNHDCDFEQADRTRELVIGGVLSHDGKNIDESIVAACTKVQDNFFDFLHRQTGWTSQSPIHRLAYSRDLDHEGVKIRVNCINTAWISQRHERQSELLFPVQYLEPTPGGFQLVVTMFHHPYGWLPSPNAQALRKHVEENSDVILTGHEHEGNAFTKEAFSGENTTYLEGGVLQDTQYKNVSTLNLLLIDLDQRRLKVDQYEWSEELYKPYFQSSWKPFLRGTLFLRNTFPISRRFLGDLNDPGAQFAHPGADRISLTDLFVPPDFRETLPPKIKRRAARDLVPGTQVLKEISLEALHLITGAEKSGKTALAKHIYLEAHTRGMVPLLLNGREIRKTNIDRVEQYIEKAFGNQYDVTLFERFRQLPKTKKLLVLDDFQAIELGTDSKIRLLRILRARFGGFVVFGDDVVRLQELSSKRGEALFADFKQYQILELGFVLREKLTERWLSIGRDESLPVREHEAELRDYTHKVEIVLGNNLVPNYPIFVLIVLQQITAQTPINTTAGSYGYFYEYLITEALAATSAIKDVDLKYNYIAELAFRIYEKKQHYLTETQLQEFHDFYNQEYQLSVRYDEIKNDLLNSDIVGFSTDGNLRFKYRYVYYYFVARHLSGSIREEKTRTLVYEMARRVHREEYANILIFLSYLSKDPMIIEAISTNARSLFPNSPPCDLDTSVEFLNKLQATIPQLMLGDGDPRENRLRVLRRLDESSTRRPDPRADADIDSDEEQEQGVLDEFLKLNSAFKTVEIIGQILRNYAGSMKGDQKLELASDCFGLALRTLSFVYKFIEQNLDGFIEFFLDRLEPSDIEDFSVDGLLTEAKRYVFLITHWWAILVVKRLSYSAGSADLHKTYAELLEKNPATSTRIVDLAIKLDHFRNFPAEEALTLAERVKANYFSFSIVRLLIANYFYMTHVDERIRNSVCDKLQISIVKGKALDPRRKRRALMRQRDRPGRF